MTRPTIRTVAAAAGVSSAAVSHAMNGRGNISPATVRRIKKVADELGWRPASAGRRLSGVMSNVGLVVARSQDDFERDAAFVHILASISAELSARELTLLLAFFADPDEALAAYRRWWQEQNVDGFILLDPVIDDPRTSLLDELRARAVTIGRSADPARIPEVVVADEHTMTEVMAYVRARGHEELVRVSEPADSVAVAHRNEMYCSAHNEVFGHAGQLFVTGRSTGPADALDMVVRDGRPRPFLVDNEVMASRLMSAARTRSLRVPDDVSVISWEDSWVCDVIHPQLTALSPPLEQSARAAIDILETLLHNGVAESARVGSRVLVERDSVATIGP